MITNRLKQLIENEKISIRVFEEKIGASQGSINKAINSNADLKANTLNNIVEVFPRYNIVWLLTGKGPMISLASTKNSDTANEPGVKYGKCHQCEEKERLIQEKEERIQELKETIAILKENCKGKQRSA